MYDPAMRSACEELRDLIRKNTLDEKHNKCDFDLTEAERKLLGEKQSDKEAIVTPEQ